MFDIELVPVPRYYFAEATLYKLCLLLSYCFIDLNSELVAFVLSFNNIDFAFHNCFN